MNSMKITNKTISKRAQRKKIVRIIVLLTITSVGIYFLLSALDMGAFFQLIYSNFSLNQNNDSLTLVLRLSFLIGAIISNILMNLIRSIRLKTVIESVNSVKKTPSRNTLTDFIFANGKYVMTKQIIPYGLGELSFFYFLKDIGLNNHKPELKSNPHLNENNTERKFALLMGTFLFVKICDLITASSILLAVAIFFGIILNSIRTPSLFLILSAIFLLTSLAAFLFANLLDKSRDKGLFHKFLNSLELYSNRTRSKIIKKSIALFSTYLYEISVFISELRNNRDETDNKNKADNGVNENKADNGVNENKADNGVNENKADNVVNENKADNENNKPNPLLKLFLHSYIIKLLQIQTVVLIFFALDFYIPIEIIVSIELCLNFIQLIPAGMLGNIGLYEFSFSSLLLLQELEPQFISNTLEIGLIIHLSIILFSFFNLLIAKLVHFSSNVGNCK